MRIAGESENYGIEQARLRITSMRAAAGPGTEFLEYLAPGDGRPYPADARANDLLHWQTRLAVRNADQAAQALRKARARFVSPGPVLLPEPSFGYAKEFLVRDPDGHSLMITETN